MANPNENVISTNLNPLPGNANQGAILFTRNVIQNPPFNEDDFIWKAMEDVIGVANVRLDYNAEENTYTLYKAKGHQDNEGNWSYKWEAFGSWESISEETAEALKNLKYVDYRFTQTTVDDITTLTMYGVKKDGTEDVITTITFVQKAYVDRVVANVRNILVQAPLTSIDSGNDRTIGLNYDTDDFTISNNKLKTNVINDSLNTSAIKTWSIDKIKEYAVANGFQYAGEVQDKTLLPDAASKGAVFGVINEADLYVNINPITQSANWYPFTYIAESFQAYAIELHKGTNGMYAKLRYDDVDFTIDNLLNLKSQLIDDTIDASNPLSNRKTYSINKILDLLSSMFRYKGQVNYYDLLPTTGNKVGDSWNVKYVGTSTQGSTELDGDNYAWNGTSWDDLSGEYRAGAGIAINGKTISATGISFIVGDGLQATGAGTTQTLSTRITNGLERVNVGTETNPVYADGVKAGSAIAVNANGVNVKTGDTIKTDSTTGNLEVDYANGLTQDANNKLITKNGKGLAFDTDGKIDIAANFNIKTTPLGTDSSKLAIFSDGKIAVDFTESPVVLTGELLYEGYFPNGYNYLTNVTIPNLNTYDMLVFDMGARNNNTNVWNSYKQDVFFKPSSVSDLFQIAPARSSVQGDVPTGLLMIQYYYKQVNAASNNIALISGYYITSWTSGAWTSFASSAGTSAGVKIYGIKAR